MTRLAKYVKSPDEVKRYSIEYYDWLDTTETLSSVVFEVTPATSPALAVQSSQIVVGDSGSLSQLRFFVGGGISGTSYSVTVTAETSGGQTKQDTVLFVIRDV